MSSHAQTRHVLELAYAQHRGKRRDPKRKPGIPRPPKTAELVYTKALRAMVAKMGEATMRALAPVLASLPTEERQDAPADGDAGAARISMRERIGAIIEETIAAGVVNQALGAVDRHSVADIARVLGIGPELLVPGLSESMHIWRRENVGLIQSIGAEYLGQVEALVTEATTQGIRAEALKQQLVDRLGVAQSRAELIAVDQVLKANAQLAQERYQRVGVTRYRWSTSHDERVRDSHKELGAASDRGTIYRFSDPPVVDKKTGRRANPGGDFRCRCVAIAVLDD